MGYWRRERANEEATGAQKERGGVCAQLDRQRNSGGAPRGSRLSGRCAIQSRFFNRKRYTGHLDRMCGALFVPSERMANAPSAAETRAAAATPHTAIVQMI
uniref:Uncharacterized protein n=1 Tax=Plectus sambesii TaxID=2011161 RepID=A0A914UL75_9BILA